MSIKDFFNMGVAFSTSMVGPDGVMKTGGDVRKGCEITAAFVLGCKGTFPGLAVHKHTIEPISTGASMTDDITLYMEWNSSDFVNWKYQLNGINHTMGAFKKETQQNANFATGTFGPCGFGVPAPNCLFPTPQVYYFQTGVGSRLEVPGGWAVKISNPSYQNVTNGSYSPFLQSRIIQGSLAWWDNTFKWGGFDYSGATASEHFCQSSSFPPGQVKFTYGGTQNTVQTGTKLRGIC